MKKAGNQQHVAARISPDITVHSSWSDARHKESQFELRVSSGPVEVYVTTTGHITEAHRVLFGRAISRTSRDKREDWVRGHKCLSSNVRTIDEFLDVLDNGG